MTHDCTSHPNVMMKNCYECRKFKSLDKFYKASPNRSAKFGVKGRCKSCQTKTDVYNKMISRIKQSLNKFLQEAPYAAAIRIMKEEPDLMNFMVQKYPHRMRQYTEEERIAIVVEAKKRSVRYAGSRTNIHHDEIEGAWREAVKKLNLPIKI